MVTGVLPRDTHPFPGGAATHVDAAGQVAMHELRRPVRWEA